MLSNVKHSIWISQSWSAAPRDQEVDNLEDLDEAEVKCATEREAGWHHRTGAAMSIADVWRCGWDGLGRAQKSCQSQCQFCQSTELIMKVMIDLYWFEPFIVSRSHSTMLKSQCSAGRQLLKRKRSGRDAQSSSQKLSEKPTAGTAVDRIVVAVWLMMVKIIKHEQTWCLVYVRIGVCSCPHIALLQLTETYIFPNLRAVSCLKLKGICYMFFLYVLFLVFY